MFADVKYRDKISKLFHFNISLTFYEHLSNRKGVQWTHKIKTGMKEVLTMNKNDQQFMAQKIRTQYMEKEPSELDALRALDSKVKFPANMFAYIFGGISAMIMGGGMSLVMTDIGASVGIAEPMLPGVIIGVLGLAMAVINYPLYKKVLEKRKKTYADKILALSEKIMNT